jgi:hypothetical protein
MDTRTEREARSYRLTVFLMSIVISLYMILAMHGWAGNLLCWICGGGFLASYNAWRKASH